MKKGKIEGGYFIFDQNGNRTAEYIFKDGLGMGPYKEFYSNGVIKRSGRLKNTIRY